MAYSDELDFQYAKVNVDEAKMRIEHTTDKWETAKSVTQKLFYLLCIIFVLYIFWALWNVYFVIGFFASLPFTFIPARKLVRVRLRWFLQIDVKAPRFNIYGVPASWKWTGDALPATDNADNQINIVRTFEETGLRSIETTMSTADFDRLEFINDARTLERVVEDKERLTARLHFYKRNFWNQVIRVITELQEASISVPIDKLLRKESIDLDYDSSVGKSPKTNIDELDRDES